MFLDVVVNKSLNFHFPVVYDYYTEICSLLHANLLLRNIGQFIQNITLCDFNLFKFTETCFMAQDMSLLVNIPCACEKNVYSALVSGIV